MQLATYPWTTIDGVEVITATNATCPLPHPGKDRPYLYQNIFDVLLADGRTVVGCAYCEYTHRSIHGVRAHMKKHNQKPAPEEAAPKKAAPKRPTPQNLSIPQVSAVTTFSRPNRNAKPDIDLRDVVAAVTALPAVQAENAKLRASLKEANIHLAEWKDRAINAEAQLDEIRAGLAAAISRTQR